MKYLKCYWLFESERFRSYISSSFNVMCVSLINKIHQCNSGTVRLMSLYMPFYFENVQ